MTTKQKKLEVSFVEGVISLWVMRRTQKRFFFVQLYIWKNMMNKIQSYFPYQFTAEQQQAVDEIRQDLSSGKQMSRILMGEVGSGKSAVIFYIAVGLALQGKRSLIIAPTTILAQQHSDVLAGLGWIDAQLVAKSSQDNGAMITIGAHCILGTEQLLKSATFVCFDEFSKFGVSQRGQAQHYHPHLLLVSATPIPRTLAATVFGDLDVSTIRELPIKRGTIITKWVLPSRRDAMYEIIERELAKGKQAYVVYPRIKGDEDVVSAEKGFYKLSYRFKAYEETLLTGQTKPDRKHELLQRFREGHTDILVSTIIAEVGLDNPNATVMVVEGADRFGLSQLHQLRGRVCRSTDTAFCFLISDSANEKSIARLDIIEKCNDGFEIAEADLRLRGPGELFSTRQHGLPDLKFASLVDDYDLMVEAKQLAQTIPVDAGVREMMRTKYVDVLQFGNVV